MNKWPFLPGLCWVLFCSLFLWWYFRDEQMIATVFGINGVLFIIYFLLFYNIYRGKKNEFTTPALLLITLQMLFFLTLIAVFWFGEWPFLWMFCSVMVFLGMLFLQVREQISHLKSLEKSNK